MNRFQTFLDSRLKLDAILNTSIGGDKDVPYAKNLPDCDFSSEGTLECEPDRCKFPVTVLYVYVIILVSFSNFNATELIDSTVVIPPFTGVPRRELCSTCHLQGT